MTTVGDEARSWGGAIGGRAWLGFLLLGAGALDAEPVAAQTAQDKHHLTATAGDNFHGDTEVDRFDGQAEAFWQDGVGGVNPGFFAHHAEVDSDSGVMAISSVFATGGAEDPIYFPGINASGALIEESIDPGPLTSGTTLTLTAQLHWDGSGSVGSGSGDTDSGSVSAGLTVNNCRAGFTAHFFSSGFGTSDPTEDCPSTFYVTGVASAGAQLLTVMLTITEPAAVPTRFYVTAQISGEAASLEYHDSGQYEASGSLTIEVSGVDYSFSSPTFLTVPEPDEAALAATALGALTALARRRRSVLA